MLRILIVGLKDNENLGDVVISETTEFLIKKVFNDLSISNYELNVIDMTNEKEYVYIDNSDLIIFAGGGILKYKYQNFHNYIDTITLLADNKNIPVVFNAVGVEGYDEFNESCSKLYTALQRKCVKQITVRDDYELLINRAIKNKNIIIKKVADPAVWTSDVYNKERNFDSNVIGLGVVREGIFKSNGIDIGLDDLLELWSGIIYELERQNENWCIFTTGWPSDTKFAIKLFEYMGREREINDKLVKQPRTSNELIDTISNFKAIIAGRLHANIIAYSLDIPSIGLVWNDKCAFWGKNIGYPERFFCHNEFDPLNMVNECKRAINDRYNKNVLNRVSYQQTTYDSLKEFFQEHFLNKSNNDIEGA